MRITQCCKNPKPNPIQWKPACPYFFISIFSIVHCTGLIELLPTCDEWNDQWQHQISLPPQIKRVVGSWYRDIVSLPFLSPLSAFLKWSGCRGSGGTPSGLSSLFDHWSPWPCLKGLNLSWPYQGIFLSEGDRGDVYQEWGCCGEIDRSVFPLEWRWRDVMSFWGMWKHARTCIQGVCKSEVRNSIQAALIFLTL